MILSVDNLSISFNSPYGRFRAVDRISFSLEKGKALGLIGESGCGKSVTAMALMGLHHYSNARVESGRIEFNGRDLMANTEEEWRAIRGRKIAMIFQEPMTSLNPVFRVGDQILESILTHQELNYAEAKRCALEMMTQVGIPEVERRFEFYPHELSGHSTLAHLDHNTLPARTFGRPSSACHDCDGTFL